MFNGILPIQLIILMIGEMAYADLSIVMGTSEIAPGNQIFFGVYDSNPVQWRILGNGNIKALGDI